jgi:hypothetical protein
MKQNKNHFLEVPTDGHCLIHCLSEATNIRLEKLKNKFNDYLIANNMKYKEVLPNNWKFQLQNYINKKRWNSELVDVAPRIFSDMLARCIVIIAKEGDTFKSATFNEEFGIWKHHLSSFMQPTLQPNPMG